MIIRPRPSTLGLLFALRGSILPRTVPKILLVALVAACVVASRRIWPATLPDLTAMPFTLLGLGLSIFLGFRNNACYERWWEGRKQWGALLAESRNLARNLTALLPPEDARRLALHLVAFARALRDQLRGDPPPEAPDAILRALEAELTASWRAGLLPDILLHGLTERIATVGRVQAACERLRATPTPFAYSLLLHRTAWLFCLLLPFGIANAVGFATPLVVAVLAYAFFGLDAIGGDLEAPFGRTDNALPLDAMVRNIEIAVGTALGETDLPEPLAPVGMVLL